MPATCITRHDQIYSRYMTTRRLYRRHAVREDWIVDMDTRVVELSRANEDVRTVLAEQLV